MRERVGDAGSALLRALPGAPQPECDIVGDGEPGDGGVLLEHDPDAVRHGTANRLVLEFDGALGRGRKPGHQFEQGRLAAARRADDGEEFALAQIEIDRAERVQVACRRPESIS